jgi:hypothetical protein
VEANEPRILAHYVYLGEDQTEVLMVQIHHDAESAELHMQVAAYASRSTAHPVR